MRDARAALDTAVRAACGMGKNADILTHLLILNQACAEREKSGQEIPPPGLPLSPEDPAFITADCIEASPFWRIPPRKIRLNEANDRSSNPETALESPRWFDKHAPAA